MQLSYSPYLAISIPWGQAAGSIPAIPYEKMSLSGMFITASKRMIRPLYGIRIDLSGNLYFLFEFPQGAGPSERTYRLMSFNTQGAIIDQFDFMINAKNISTWRVIDFAPDNQNGVYLLELLETDQRELFYRLRRLDQQGHELWAKKGDMNYKSVDFGKFEGRFEYLLVPDKESLFLPARYPQKGLARIDVSTGDILSVYEWDEPSDRLTIGRAGEVYYSRLLEDASGKRHVLIRRKLMKEAWDIIESEIQYLHDLAGVDSDGAIYPRMHDGIARLSPTGQLQWEQHIHGLTVRADDEHVFICSRADVVDDIVILEVDHYDTSGARIQTLEFQLPEHHVPVKGDLPRLVSVDAKSQFYFYGGETDHQGGTLFVFSVDGELETVLPLNETDVHGAPLFDKVNQYLMPLETRAGSPSMFEVDRAGNVYIPLSDPAGFKVICLRPREE